MTKIHKNGFDHGAVFFSENADGPTARARAGPGRAGIFWKDSGPGRAISKFCGPGHFKISRAGPGRATSKILGCVLMYLLPPLLKFDPLPLFQTSVSKVDPSKNFFFTDLSNSFFRLRYRIIFSSEEWNQPLIDYYYVYYGSPPQAATNFKCITVARRRRQKILGVL